MAAENEYTLCIRLAMDLGKTYDQAKTDWLELNNGISLDTDWVHSNWVCCA